MLGLFIESSKRSCENHTFTSVFMMVSERCRPKCQYLIYRSLFFADLSLTNLRPLLKVYFNSITSRANLLRKIQFRIFIFFQCVEKIINHMHVVGILLKFYVKYIDLAVNC